MRFFLHTDSKDYKDIGFADYAYHMATFATGMLFLTTIETMRDNICYKMLR